MQLIDWRKDYNIEIKELNIEHKKIIELINKVHYSMDEKHPNEEIAKIMKELFNIIEKHFATEEIFLKEYNPKNIKSHLKEHEKFKRRIKTFEMRLETGELELDYEIIDFLSSWFHQHILNFDKKIIKKKEQN